MKLAVLVAACSVSIPLAADARAAVEAAGAGRSRFASTNPPMPITVTATTPAVSQLAGLRRRSQTGRRSVNVMVGSLARPAPDFLG